ncbi:NAD(P)H-binding protein [Aquitalea aquatica]|uniref:NAD(P)H-binding protein n=1 Tax=Aquitalea aquatica TaxID=3044273 RepID=A0A838XUW8_9NEIS|nr:NAD(P)H-binding protein [Aquitalea magnusonii]MBA4706930.1 NAD(P)H-binding protein [Aquitalea magnusonii]
MRTLLIAGLGDVARRALPELVRHWRVFAIAHHPAAAKAARQGGALPIMANLDCQESLRRIAGLADDVWITAPPPASGLRDNRTRKLLYALAKADRIPQRISYISTTGVYGNGDGAWLDECSALHAQTERARRRVDAETALRDFAGRHGCQLNILRAPGIYALERLPLTRLLQGTPLILPAEDSYSNHIHADDLARLCIASLQQQRGGIRVFNACDDEPLTITDWYVMLAEALALPIPPQLSRAEVRQQVSPALWSYMAESRRIRNVRLAELGVALRYPTAREFVAQLAANPAWQAVALAKAGKIR